MQQDNQILAGVYAKVLEPFWPYMAWLEKQRGSSPAKMYDGSDEGRATMPFPVYDAQLMAFVRLMEKSPMMDRNYPYLYTRLRIKDVREERALISKAAIQDWDMLCCILSRYVLGGRTKGRLWSQGVEEGIFLAVLTKMREIIVFWTSKEQGGG